MNTKITFPELINAISIATNTTKRISETFLKEFFAVITESLINGESVKIKRIGTFKLAAVDVRKSVNVNTGEEIEIPAHNRLVFTPDKELADAVNMPFSSFETIELSDVIPESDLEKFNDTTSELLNVTTESQPVVVDDRDNNVEVIEDTTISQDVEKTEDIYEQQDVEPIVEDIAITADNSIDQSNQITEKIEVNPEIDSTDEEKHVITEEFIQLTTDNGNEIGEIPEITPAEKSDQEQHCQPTTEIKYSFAKGFFWGFICSLFTSAAMFFIFAELNGFPIIINNSNDTITEIADSQVKPQLSVDPVAKIELTKTPKDIIEKTVILDTITQKKFLTTLARKYYGDYNFWVYIYAENSAALGNPNKIKPGTVVVIPPAEKYNIDKGDKNSLNEARKKALVIFKKYE